MSDFVKNKIKAAGANKKAGPATRARKETKISSALTKIIKKSASIADLMTGEDQAEDMQILRDAKRATHGVYCKETGGLVQVPDHKIRLAAFALSRGYDEGTPIARSMGISGTFDDFAAMLEKSRQSPETMRLLQFVTGGELPAPEGVQETSAESKESVINLPS